MAIQILWVEDSAKFELSNLMGPILFDETFDFHLAEDITSAVDYVLMRKFDILIVDIRLPPGPDEFWGAYYEKAANGKVFDQLGFRFLYWLLSRENSYKHKPPLWVNPKRIAVFTVENLREIQSYLNDLGISHTKQKTAGLKDDTLVDLINEVWIDQA